MSSPHLRNLTIRVDVRALYLSSLRAHFEGTSLNALIEAYLADYAGIEIAPRLRRRIRPLMYRDIRGEARSRARRT